HLAARILAVNLKDGLGKIQADRDSVHLDGLLRWLLAENSTPVWHIDAVRGPSTQHCEGRSRRGAVFVREAVIAGDYGGGSPFSIRAWNQGRRMLFPRPGEAEPFM
ncbi:MAG TPA: hypothetical protein VLR47_11360, partial [Rhodospirillales bacterium]|nr:hypothetical protein [Rhodospirillales bacterium]